MFKCPEEDCKHETKQNSNLKKHLWEIQQLKEKHDKLQFKFSLNCNLKIDILYINYEQL